MISKFQLIRNIGVFDSIQGTSDTKLDKLTLIYAENARGKTTLSAILRSLKSGESFPINERARLGSSHPPHVVIESSTSTQPVIFQNNSWTRNISNIIIFDDMFVDQNVSSGLKIDAGHRQNLHEIVVGAMAVELTRELYELADRIDQHNTELRRKADLIPAEARGRRTVNLFCDLEEQPDVDEAIKAEERRYNALKNSEEVCTKHFFNEISLPCIEIDDIGTILSRSLPDLDAQALDKVKEHFDKAGEGSEQWIEQGMHRIYEVNDQKRELFCPFCAQNLSNSSLISLYRVYFSEAYTKLKRDIDSSIDRIKRDFGGDAIAGFQEQVIQIEDLYRFWKPMCDLPELKINASGIVKAWQEVRKVLLEALVNKQLSPLEHFELDQDGKEKVNTFQDYNTLVNENSRELLTMNVSIRQIKEETSSGNIQEVSNNLERLKTVKKRYSSEIAPLCADFINEREAKNRTEEKKSETRDALDAHRNEIFPKYQDSINEYLRKFNASFRVGSVIPTNPRGRASCSYCLVINDVPVSLEADSSSQAVSSFKNTLSSGDRSTLALAFFFASIDQDPDLSQRVVIIDDPVTSLDDYREISTTHEIQGLISRTAQVIVLSHDKKFLCKIWENADKGNTATLEVKRAASGSSIMKWNIHSDSLTDYDVRHEELRKYLSENIGDTTKIAQNIRFVLEGFCRVAWPQHFPPGTQLGPFKGQVHQSLSSQSPLLSSDEYQEFSNLIDYANKFHHDTNPPTWEDEIRNIRDTELQGFVRRTLEFAKPR